MDKMMQEEQLIRWYETIKNLKRKEADDFKKFFESFPNLFTDRKAKHLYQLFTARYYLMYDQFERAEAKLREGTLNERESDYRLKYYYHFFKGILCHNKKDYKEALSHFVKAEPIVTTVGNPKEHAEFCYSLAKVYHETYHFMLSTDYASEALETFQAHRNYLRMAHCESVIALNYMYMKRYKEAETYLQRGLVHSSRVKDEQIKMMILQNFGTFYTMIDQPKTALTYLTQALELIHSDWSYVKVQNLFLSSECFFKTGNTEKARRTLLRTEALAHQTGLKDFSHRCKIAKALYHQQDNLKEVYKEGVAYFLSEERWDLVSKYGEELAKLYQQESLYEEACHYYSMVLDAENRIAHARMISQ